MQELTECLLKGWVTEWSMCLRLSANRVTSKRNKVVNVSSRVSLEESSLSGIKEKRISPMEK